MVGRKDRWTSLEQADQTNITIIDAKENFEMAVKKLGLLRLNASLATAHSYCA